MSWLRRALNVFRVSRVTSELDEELELHVEEASDQLIRRGMSPDEAEREARRRLGNRDLARERSLDVRLLPWLDALKRDFAFGVRMLARDRVPSLAAAISLGLAIGACTATFLLVEALILRTLPVHEPERLIYLALPSADMARREGTSFSYPLFERLRDAAEDRAELLVVGYQRQRRATFHDAPERQDRVHPQYVSGGFFGTLGITPVLGRTITPADDRRSAPVRVAVLTHAFWMRRFGGDPAILGRVFTLEGETQYEIIGIARKGFTGVEPGMLTDLWIPATTNSAETLDSPGAHWFRVLGRLAPGVRAGELQQRLQPVFMQFRRERAATFPPDRPADSVAAYVTQPLAVRSASTGPSSMRLEFERPLWVLAAIVSLVLLLACSNVANLLLARAAAREREMALRVSIGAGRRRLVQQLLIESGLLGVAACTVGGIVALAAAPMIVATLGTPDMPVHLELAADWRVGGFLLLLGIMTTVLFGLVPALRASSVSPIHALKATSGRRGSRARLLQPLVAVQVALSLAVVFLAGLLLLSFERLASADLGLETEGVVLANVEIAGQPEPETGRRALQTFVTRVASMPGVLSASLSAWPLLKGYGWTTAIRLPGQRQDPREVSFLDVSPGFFGTMGIPFRAGRDFEERDITDGTSSAVVVNESFARMFFPDQPAIGRQFERLESGTRVTQQEIVGIVADARYSDVHDEPPPTVYVPLRPRVGATLQLRTTLPFDSVAPVLRAEVERVVPRLEIFDVTLQSAVVEQGMLRERLLAQLSGFFALVSLALAAVGLYGVLSFSVVQRTREIGIRRALGAPTAAILQQVGTSVAVYGAVGAAAGLAGGLSAARLVKTLLYDVDPVEPLTLTLPLAGLAVFGAVAALVPARRAASVDPIVALREE